MQKRILFGSIMLAILGGLFYYDYQKHYAYFERFVSGTGVKANFSALTLSLQIPWLVTGLLVLLIALGFVELRKMLKNIDINIHPVSGILGSILFALISSGWVNRFLESSGLVKRFLANPICGVTGDKASLAMYPLGFNLSVVLLFVVIAVFLEQMIRGRLERAFERISGTLLAIMWLGLGGAMILAIRLDFGAGYLIIFLIATKSTDIGAYFTGSMIGKNKMIPWLSPGKSWEGLVGGLIFSGAVSVGLAWLLNLDIQVTTQTTFNQAHSEFGKIAGPGMIFWTIFGMICGLTGQFGDLCESLIKRSTKVKDSASLIPEFGGVLDLIDSPLIASAFAFAILSLWSAFQPIMPI